VSEPEIIDDAGNVRGLVAAEPEHDREVFLARVARYAPDLRAGLTAVYGAERASTAAAQALELAAARFADRPADLRLLDLRRHVEPDWFQQPWMLGYAAYAERFAEDLPGVAKRIPYLAELGVTYLHLMPLLRPRPAPNDGGYAVMDFREVREDLGTMADLADLARALRDNGISLTLDLIVNHVAREHEWARRARAGDPRYRAYFYSYPDRTMPDAFEATLPEVFPDFAPGSFSWDDEAQAWLWTTFNSWQWDLNWANPDVFMEFADLICFLANQGVECLRLDAIAFIWKRMGTNCQNQPEVHELTRALRAVARIAAPAMVFKAEAIVSPGDLVAYLGQGRTYGKVSDLAYNNSAMVHTWSALASRDARLMSRALRRIPAIPPTTAWATYLRGHDDIGWAIDDGDAASIGVGGWSHRTFLSDFYSGEFPGSFARGLVFQHNPATGDRRISGTAASLAGLDLAVESKDDALIDRAIARLLLAHAVVLGEGGLPIVFMGDELGLCNDMSFLDVPAHAEDNRWVHRPVMPWDVAEHRRSPGTVEQRIFTGLRHLSRVRARLAAMHAAVSSDHLEPADPGVLMVARRHPGEPLLGLYNMTEDARPVPARVVRDVLATEGPAREHLTGAVLSLGEDLTIPAYGAWWLTEVTA
jgi:amylosucrase